MKTLVDLTGWVNLGLYSLVALVALWHWRTGRGRAALWAALSFGAIAVAVDVSRALPDDAGGVGGYLAERTVIALLALFPYLLYRFTTEFEPPTRGLERFLGLMTVAVVTWTFVLRAIPDTGEPRSAEFTAWLVLFVLHWTILAIVVAVRLWRAGRGQPTVARRRMQLLSVASSAITLAIILVVFTTDEDSALSLASALLGTIAAIAFLLGLAPPTPLRAVWRKREQEQVQDAIARLMGATTPEQVTDEVLEPMARIVGARAVALCDESGKPVAAYGATDEMVAEACRDAAAPTAGTMRVDFPSGFVVAWTSPYAPYFGHEELRVLRTLGALTGLALDRSRLFSDERESRAALERANEVKTSFVALAAHELRTPVATIDGIVQTLHMRGDRLSEDRRALLEDTLRHQSEHMRVLVDQLLDLSRLEAEAVAIEPAPIAVRERVEHIVARTAGERADEVRVEIDDGLETLADPNAFERIVTNLVTNAFRYGSPPVFVRAERVDRHFRLAVEDRGAGVPPEFVPDLFERFTRSSPSRQRVGDGTGLGLAIARSYAQAHGGDLLYEAAQPHGARFRLVLPADTRAPAET